MSALYCGHHCKVLATKDRETILLRDLLADDREDDGLLPSLVKDGRPLIMLTGLSPALAGAFAIFQSATGHFLPHDIEFLEMTVGDLCSLAECRIVHFMFHDRVSFGGVLIAIGILYIYMAEFPLRTGEAWAWWALCASGASGFASFLTYLGYGYLDSWHAIATLALLPCYLVGMTKCYAVIAEPKTARTVTHPGFAPSWWSAGTWGRLCLAITCCGICAAGMTIMVVGMTTVFVPQDLEFIGLDRASIAAINPRLIPLIAHDRAGFGGGLCSGGIALLITVWCGPSSRSLWQALCAAGSIGFGAAIGIHPLIGYTDALHLLPAIAGATFFFAGLALTYREMHVPRPVSQSN